MIKLELIIQAETDKDGNVLLCAEFSDSETPMSEKILNKCLIPKSWCSKELLRKRMIDNLFYDMREAVNKRKDKILGPKGVDKTW